MERQDTRRTDFSSTFGARSTKGDDFEHKVYAIRQHLSFNEPLQRLYEKAHYDNYDLEKAIDKQQRDYSRPWFERNEKRKAAYKFELVYASWDDFKTVILRDVPEIGEPEFLKLMEDIPWVEDKTGPDNKVDKTGINPRTLEGQEEYKRRE